MKVIKYAAGVLVFIFLIWSVDFSALLGCVQLISAFDVLLILAISYLLIAVSVLKWAAFLEYLGVTSGFNRLFGLYLMGYFVNLLMPSYVGGDVVRALKVGQGQDKEAAFSATLLERYTGLAAMLILATSFVGIARGVTPEIRLATYFIFVLFVVGSIATFAGAASRGITFLRAPAKICDLVRRIECSLRVGMSHAPLLLRASVLSFAFHSLTVVNTVAVGYAVGWTEVPWMELFVVVPLILLIGAVPISPQGLGIQEGAFLYFLHAVGATTSEALAVALILRAKSYILALLGGCIWYFTREKKAATAFGAKEL